MYEQSVFLHMRGMFAQSFALKLVSTHCIAEGMPIVYREREDCTTSYVEHLLQRHITIEVINKQ